MSDLKHLVCYSGGHSSALVAIEVCRRFGKENTILLNHDISPKYESKDIKRFKREVADYLEIPITYANYNDLPVDELPSQFEVCINEKSFINPHTRQALCTSILKTKPFHDYLDLVFPDKNCVIYYGFDQVEFHRIERRKTILNDMGYESDYPLGLWGDNAFEKFILWLEKELEKERKKNKKEESVIIDLFSQKDTISAILNIDLKISNKNDWKRTIESTEDVNISPPNTYDNFKHANCVGCLKGGKQHWYCVYCLRYDVFEEAKESEEIIGYTIIKGISLSELEKDFEKMKCAGIEPSEHIPSWKFWKEAKKFTQPSQDEEKPCLCFI